MKTWRWPSRLTTLLAVLFLGGIGLSAGGATLQQLSLANPGVAPPGGGSGDSCVPLITPDGRYVLFASAANNLLLNSSTNPLPRHCPPCMNVYLCDRTNGTMTLVSANLAGTGGGNGDSWPDCISTNGRYALFESAASDLVAGDTNNVTDVFMRDLVAQTTLLVSVATNGNVGNGASRTAVMTPEGRFVAFVSVANNLVASDTNGMANIFVRDLQAGTTVLASVGAMPTNSGWWYVNGADAPLLTPDGRYVAFWSPAKGLVPGAGTGGDVYVRDLVGGTTTWASAGARSAMQSVAGVSNAVSFSHAISADGQYVAYAASLPPSTTNVTSGLILRYGLASGLTDLVHTNAFVPAAPYAVINCLDFTPDGRFVAFVANTNGTAGTNTCILVWDGDTGAMTLASGNASGAVPPGLCEWPALSPDGRFVGFLSSATGLTTNSLNGLYHPYVRDTQAGVTFLADADTNGVGTGVSSVTAPRLSADGRFVAFEAPGGTTLLTDSNRFGDVFVCDLVASATALISAHGPGAACLSPRAASGIGASFSLSTNGLVAFSSDADDLTLNDTNGLRDVFVRDLVHGTNLLVSVSAYSPTSGNGCSTDPMMTPDGRYVVFSSDAGNLVPSGANRYPNIYLRDLLAGTTTLLSVNYSGIASANSNSFSPTISADGRFVLFYSWATDLTPTTVYPTQNLFLKDCQTGATYALTTYGAYDALMTPDGHYVAFFGSVSAGAEGLYVWDCPAVSLVYSSTTFNGGVNGLSPSGQLVAGWVGALNPSLTLLNWTSGQTWIVVTGTGVPQASGLRFSGDDRLLVYAVTTSASPYSQVYLYDCLAMTNLLVSGAFTNAILPAFGNSDGPDISPNGRYVAYRSVASNLVPAPTTGQPALYLYDSWSNVTLLASADAFGHPGPDTRCQPPHFSSDGQTLLFASWASDLAAGDFNGSADLFAFNLGSTGALPVFWLHLLPPASSGLGPVLCWPVAPGHNYQVQFKNHLGDPVWQNCAGAVDIVGAQGFFYDPTPPGPQRFYRVVAF